LKVLLIGRYNDTKSLTGPERFAKGMLNNLSEKTNVHFADYFYNGKEYSIFQKLFGYSIINKNITRLGLFRLFFFILKFKPDVIHILNYERNAVIACFASKFFKTKLIYTSHGLIRYEDRLYNNPSFSLKLKNKFSEKYILKSSDCIVFVSEFLEQLTLKEYKFLNKKFYIIPPGVDKNFYGREVSISHSDILEIVTFEYHPSRLKGISTLISVLNENDFNDFLSVLSDSKNIIVLNHKSIILGKNDYSSYREFLKNKDVIVCLSEYDTFSLFTAEAMCSGLIPIVSEHTGIRDYITNVENGFIINNFDKSELKSVLQKISTDKTLKNKMSSYAMNIYSELNWDSVINRYFKIYNSKEL